MLGALALLDRLSAIKGTHRRSAFSDGEALRELLLGK